MKGTSRKWLQGLAISRGLVVGKIAKASRTPEFARSPLIVNSADTEWQKYLGAQENALRLIESLSVEACPRKPTTSPAEQSDLNPDQRSKDDSDSMPVVMTSYGMILSDELLMEKIRTFVFHESNDATTAILRAFKDIRSVVESMQDQYLRDKSLDLDACEELLLSAMSDSKSLNEKKSEHLKARIVVINHPTPQDIIRFHQVGVAGIIAEQGAQLSHAAILARSFNIPTIFSATNINRLCSDGQMAILDASEGKIIVNPSRSELRKAEARRAVELLMNQKLRAGAQSVARTIDGHRVIVFANADGPVDARQLLESGAEGVGLLRTEFLHLNSDSIPHEDHLEVFFRLTSESISPRWLTIRLLDAGGDKPYPRNTNFSKNNQLSLSHVSDKKSQNSPFGLRGIRFLLSEKLILGQQLRALVKANSSGNIKILIPFVTRIDEIRQVKQLVQDIWSNLPEFEKSSLKYPQVGAMVETPAAVHMIDLICAECDFVSVGSNDLTQHILCVERDDPITSKMFNSFHPALLRSLKTVFDYQRYTDTAISLCGEIASNPIATELLIGLGCRHFSCRTAAIPLIKDLIRNLDFESAKKFAEKILPLNDGDEIQNILQERYDELHNLFTSTNLHRNRAS